MPPGVAALFLLCLAFSLSTALLSTPNNVHLSSYNMNLVLRWDLPEGDTSGLLYTAEYKNPVSSYRTACMNISALECDLTHHQLSAFGEYTGRVQARRRAESSDWVESNPITLDKDTIIGPPSVSLFSTEATIVVTVKDPEFWNSDVRSVYDGVTYNITYWKRTQTEKGRKYLTTQQTRVVLKDLDTRSEYCVQVRLTTDRNSNPSVPSNITCERSTEPVAPWIAAVLVFAGISLAVALVVAVVIKWKKISNFLFPTNTLPQCLIESVLAPPVPTLHPVKELHPQEEICDQILLMTGDRSAEEETPQPEATEGETAKRRESLSD
ncbi:unnamed protein product [Ophioblennius macclurei]